MTTTLAYPPRQRSICWTIAFPTTSSSTAVSISKLREHRWVPRYRGSSQKRCYKDSKEWSLQLFPLNSGNVILIIRLQSLNKTTSERFINCSTKRYPESASRWRQLQKTNYLSWMYLYINSHPGRSKHQCTEQMWTSSSTTIATVQPATNAVA